MTEPKSIAAYGLMEVKLIWAMVKSYDLKTNSKNQIFCFNDSQKDALADLVAELNQFPEHRDDDAEVQISDAVSNLLGEVYFPEGDSTTGSFDNPALTFAALQCLADTGAYSSIFLIPPILAKLQYSFRLQASKKFLLSKAKYPINQQFFK